MTPHFTMHEFTRSSTAARAGIDNSLPTELVPVALATLQMLERIRAHLSQVAGRDVPVSITSGYRSLALNRRIGSADTSDHVRAMAADIEAPAFGTPYEVCRELAPRVGLLGIGQLINEMPPHGWVHVSTRLPSKMGNRIITAYPGGRFAAGVVA